MICATRRYALRGGGRTAPDAAGVDGPRGRQDDDGLHALRAGSERGRAREWGLLARHCRTEAHPYHSWSMTAKEQLRQRIEQLTEDEAAETLRLLDQRTDALTRLLDDAPLDDEPTTAEEEAAVQVARDEIARGETITP